MLKYDLIYRLSLSIDVIMLIMFTQIEINNNHKYKRFILKSYVLILVKQVATVKSLLSQSKENKDYV